MTSTNLKQDNSIELYVWLKRIWAWCPLWRRDPMIQEPNVVISIDSRLDEILSAGDEIVN